MYAINILPLDIGVIVAGYVPGGGVVSTVGNMVQAEGTVAKGVRDCAVSTFVCAFRTPSCSMVKYNSITLRCTVRDFDFEISCFVVVLVFFLTRHACKVGDRRR